MERICERLGCETSLYDRHSSRKYCSRKCFKKAHYARRTDHMKQKTKEYKAARRGTKSKNLCACGCGVPPPFNKGRYRNGHNPDKPRILKTPEEKEQIKLIRKAASQARRYSKEGRIRFLVKGAIGRAKQSGRPYDKDILILLAENPTEICPCCKEYIDYTTRGKYAGSKSPSIDRVDNSKGYVKGNVQVICNQCNSIKNVGTILQHQNIVNYIRQHLEVPDATVGHSGVPIQP